MPERGEEARDAPGLAGGLAASPVVATATLDLPSRVIAHAAPQAGSKLLAVGVGTLQIFFARELGWPGIWRPPLLVSRLAK